MRSLPENMKRVIVKYALTDQEVDKFFFKVCAWAIKTKAYLLKHKLPENKENIRLALKAINTPSLSQIAEEIVVHRQSNPLTRLN